MSADLYNEIGQLKRENEALKRLADTVPNLERELKDAVKDVTLYKKQLEQATKLKVQAEAMLNTERTSKKALAAAVDTARKAQLDAEKMVGRLQSDLKFDKMAREGQVKKARILEHEVTEYKHENFLQTKLRSEAEHRAITANVALQKERSMRLQDIHSRNKVIIAKQVSERNEKIAEFERFKEVAKAKQLESEVGGLKAAVKSQTQIIGLNDYELNASLAEVELVRSECNKLKKQLLDAEEQVLHHVEVRRELEQECHRLGTELMVQSKTATERTRPLITAQSGRGSVSLSLEKARSGMTRPETTSAARIRRRAQTVKSREFSRVFTSQGAARSASAGGFGAGSGSLTLDEAFVIPIYGTKQEVRGGRQVGLSLVSADGVVDGGLGQTSPDGRLGSAGVSWGDARGSLQSQGGGARTLSPMPGSPMQRMPSALKKTRSAGGVGGAIMDEGGLGGVEDSAILFGGGSSFEMAPEDNNMRDTRAATADPIKKTRRPKSRTLNVPGSLFLGSGLGLKKSIESN
jgi:hypothetical protein